MLSERMILLPVSPAVAKSDPKWAKQVKQTGYWFARPIAGWRPPQGLLDFLQAGEKPIMVSLGVMSTSGRKARESARIVLDAVRKADVRAVLQGWDGEMIKAGTIARAPSENRIQRRFSARGMMKRLRKTSRIAAGSAFIATRMPAPFD